MKVVATFGLLIMPLLALADEAPDGNSVLVKENAVNIPVGRILLAKREKGYCAVKFISSSWSKDESYAEYVGYYISDSATSFTDPEIKPGKDKVYEKPPLSIIGRFALSRTQDAVFCGEITLKWSGGPNGTAWIYFDESKMLELASTKWRNIRDVNIKDPNLKWFRYGDIGSHPKRLD